MVMWVFPPPHVIARLHGSCSACKGKKLFLFIEDKMQKILTNFILDFRHVTVLAQVITDERQIRIWHNTGDNNGDRQ